MNQELWHKIEQFDFDNPPGEYSFSLRLASENYWTRNFTEQAILEYKKFMYLAATSDMMVSPSAIVDTVWHQHLIFTQLYQEFCNLIGKQVQHVPSTHNREDAQKFKQAKERTAKLYKEVFGDPPAAIWDYGDMYESLNLAKAKHKIRTFIIVGILAFIVLVTPFYFALRPLYVTIGNPSFMFALTALVALTFIVLESYNQKALRKITAFFDKQSFIYNLQPGELIYLKTRKLSSAVDGVVNELIETKCARVNSDDTIELVASGVPKTNEHLQSMMVLDAYGKKHYPSLSAALMRRPIFGNIETCMDAFKKYVNKSEKFGKLFYANFAVLSFVLMLGFVRLITGVLRDKPVLLIAILVVVILISMIGYLNRLTHLVGSKIIPGIYRDEILVNREDNDDRQWQYFLSGRSVLAASFIPLVDYVERNESTWGSSCGSSDGGSSGGSSCGSSCSSCGGCGGGD